MRTNLINIQTRSCSNFLNSDIQYKTTYFPSPMKLNIPLFRQQQVSRIIKAKNQRAIRCVIKMKSETASLTTKESRQSRVKRGLNWDTYRIKSKYLKLRKLQRKEKHYLISKLLKTSGPFPLFRAEKLRKKALIKTVSSLKLTQASQFRKNSFKSKEPRYLRRLISSLTCPTTNCKCRPKICKRSL